MTELDKLEAYLKDKCIEYKRTKRYYWTNYPEFPYGKEDDDGKKTVIVIYKSKTQDFICHAGSYKSGIEFIEVIVKRNSNRAIKPLSANDVIKMIEEESK